jgi:hypothetical protein
MRAVAAARRQVAEFAAAQPRAYAVAEARPHHVPMQKRGDPDEPGEVVPRGFPAFLGGKPLRHPAAGSGRDELAEWLTSPRHPLTARVMVNRIWQGHFGTGLVATPNDFGTRGARPSHPELLDWLSARFVAGGWSIKSMHRLIMLSNAYQRSSNVANADERMESTQALTHFQRRRLSAEEIRDSLLAVSGELDRSPGGPHPFPDPKTWQFTQHSPFSAVYDHNRRSVYLMTQRLKRHPFLALFDGPDPSASTGLRYTTTVPTQSLFFLNDPFVHARARSLAAHLAPLGSDETRLQRAFLLLYGRPPRQHEIDAARNFLAGGDWPAWLRVMLAANEFVYVD